MILQLNVETKMEINTLADLSKLKGIMENLQMKINKSQLAKELGVSWPTIDKYLKGFKPKKTRDKPSKIDELYPIIKELLSSESAQRFYYKQNLFQYLKDNHQLDCSASNFRNYISKHPEFQEYFDSKTGRKRGGKETEKQSSKKSAIRFETTYGDQAQLDWKENIQYLTKDGEILNINVCVLLLSASRFRFYYLSLSKTQDVLLSFLTQCFESLGGVPKAILNDNMKTVMDEPRTPSQSGKINVKYAQFASDFGFEVKPCMVRRAQTKGKVESNMKFLDEIHAYQGKFNYEELFQYIQKLNTRINETPSQATGIPPILAIQKEKNLLQPLPQRVIRDSYKISNTQVKVNTSAMISYKGNQYSVDAEYIGKVLNLQVEENRIHLYYGTKLVALHNISDRKLNYHHEHYQKHLKNYFSGSDIEEMAQKNLELIDEVYNNGDLL